MTTKTFTHLITLIALGTTIGCKMPSADEATDEATDDIAGEWEGEIGDFDSPFKVEFDLEHDEDNKYSGSGKTEWACYTEWEIDGEWDSQIVECDIEFDIIAETEGVQGEQKITFELENCIAVMFGDTTDIGCGGGFEVDWDGKDNMYGDFEDDQHIELERN